MRESPSPFPFPKSFQFREYETVALEALFERSFFDASYSEEAIRSLERIRFRREPENGAVEDGSEEPVRQPEATADGRGRLAGASSVILCRGANGIGKTRIFRHLRSHAHSREIPVYEAYHYDVEGIPHKPFLHTIREILRDLDSSSSLQEKYRYALERLIPEVFADGRASPGASKPDRGPWNGDLLPEEKVKVFDGITQLLLELAARKPLLILVHDLHWGDLATVELLSYIGRNAQLRNQLAARSGWDPASRTGASRSGARSARNGVGGERGRRDRLPVGDELRRSSLGHAGADLNELEAERWSVLTPRPVAPHVYGSWLDDGGESDAGGFWAGSPAQASAIRPARLMILANYHAFREDSHYIQESIDRLGEESYAYHAELRPLSREEADRFIEKSTDGVMVGGASLDVTPDAVEAIHEVSEGFPSFQHELFRGLFLADGETGRWTADTVWSYLGVVRAPGEEPDGPGEEESGGSAKVEEEGKGTSPRRRLILERRLADCSPGERRILSVLALARRPLKAPLVARLLAGLHEDGGLEANESPGNDGEVPPGGEAAVGEDEGSTGDVVPRGEAAVGEDEGSTGDVVPRGEAAVGEDEGSTGFEGPEDAEAILRQLEERGIVERSDRSRQGVSTAEPDTYFFRLLDYVEVVEAGIGEDLARRIHLRLADELAEDADSGAGEGAFEVYYHYRRSAEPSRAVPFGVGAAERFVRSLALQKARLLYRELVDLLQGDEARAERLSMLEKAARISAALKDYGAAEEILRQIQRQEGGALSPEARFELLALEAEVAGVSDPYRALKILSKGSKLVEKEVSPQGARLQLLIARYRLERQDWKRAINFGLKGLSICQKLGNGSCEPSAFYQLIGRAFYRKGDYAHAVDNYQRGLEEAERRGNRRLHVGILDELGRVYLERGEYFRSARYLYKALEIRERDADVAGLSRSYDQLALCYQRSGDYLRTIENLNRSLHLKERIGDIEGLNPTLGTLGELYFRLGHFQRAILYFRREMDNSRLLKATKMDETVWLADAFVRLGRVYAEVGEVRQAESLCKQALILASEFKHRAPEADALLLDGNLKAFRRDWSAAEKSLRSAAEIHAKLGHRRREASGLLDLGEVKFAREQYDEALKLSSRAQIIADEIKARDLQVRALTLKGNVHRFLKGGNFEKVTEHLNKALDVAQKLSDVAVLFNLFYSFAKASHAEQDFTEAANYYGKAESILLRILEFLPDDLSARYQEDRHRKVFQEDLARFRKEAQSRSATIDARERGLTGADLRDRPAGVVEYKDLLSRILRVNESVNQLHFYERLLAECVELAGGDRGIILRVQKREYIPVAFQGFGKDPQQHPEYAAAAQLGEETVRRGKAIVLASGEEGSGGRFAQLTALAGRSVLVVPVMTAERIFGGIYVDKPASLGRFGTREMTLLESFAEHAGAAFLCRRQLDIAIQEPLTGFFTPSYFIDRLKEAYRWFNLHGKVFSLAGYYLPALEHALGEGRESLGEKLSREVTEVLPYRTAICWGNPILYIFLDGMDLPAAKEVADRVRERLEELLAEEVPSETLAAESRYQQGSEMYFEIRLRLLPEDGDQKTLMELRRILSQDLTIKEAKQVLERHIIERTLRRTHGNITHAARQLGIHRPQLSNLLKKYDLKREVFEQPAGPGP